MRFVLIGAALLIATAAQAQRLPDGFVYLRDVDPSIVQDMRYASANNFTGAPLPGYGAAECVLRADAAQALKRVQTSLAGSGVSLKVYDCYRPERAVRGMARWASGDETGATKRFYPGLSKRTLFAAGWISPRSAHSAGVAVDLTLAPAGAQTAPFDPHAHYGPCDGAIAQRAPDTSVDMGTGFDCFSLKSYTRSSAIGAEPRALRERLRSAMMRQGFKNYFREWWHFAYDGTAPPALHDTPIAPRRTGVK
jgi:D-alanyl-D-alanine dipeptidase